MARAWIHQCQISHTICLRGVTPELPTRVIDVGLNDNGTYEPPRVFLSQGAKATYVALSHCWGGKISCVLNAQTITEFQKSIPWSLLPANFQLAGCHYHYKGNRLSIHLDRFIMYSAGFEVRLGTRVQRDGSHIPRLCCYHLCHGVGGQ